MTNADVDYVSCSATRLGLGRSRHLGWARKFSENNPMQSRGGKTHARAVFANEPSADLRHSVRQATGPRELASVQSCTRLCTPRSTPGPTLKWQNRHKLLILIGASESR